MKKSELKSVMKPIIEEVVKEMLFEEEGVLSHIIKEVVQAHSGMTMIRESATQGGNSADKGGWEDNWRNNRLQQLKAREAVSGGVQPEVPKALQGVTKALGFNVFEGVKPIKD